MNYIEKVQELVDNYVSPCDAEVKPGFYRRVQWEKYNPQKLNIMPMVNEEWSTEILERSTRLYSVAPFTSSEKFPKPVEPEDGSGSSGSGSSGSGSTKIWVSKLGIYFDDENEIQEYVDSIGSEITNTTTWDWYGADLSKSDLFKTAFEHNMYSIENAGGSWHKSGPKIDKRTMLQIDSDYVISINYYGINDYRCAYLRHYDDKPCAYIGFKFYSDIDSSEPPSPVPTEAPTIGDLPYNFWPESKSFKDTRMECVPFEAKFPYSGLSKALLEAWNRSSSSAKLWFNLLPGLPSTSAGFSWATVYNKLSVAMSELGEAAVAMGEEMLRKAWASFQEIMESALAIFGGAWDVLLSFLPKINILGIAIDIQEFCTGENGVDGLRNKLSAFSIEDVIKDIYAKIGSSYNYAVERVKMFSKDLVVAIRALYEYCWQQMLQAGTALGLFMVELALKLFEKPDGNPLYKLAAIFKNMFLETVKPLGDILSGKFPGFGPDDVYEAVMSEINRTKDLVYAEIRAIEIAAQNVQSNLTAAILEAKNHAIKYKEYISGMHGTVTDAITEGYKRKQAELNALASSLQEQFDNLKQASKDAYAEVSDVLTLALDYFLDLPIIAVMNKYLALIGSSVQNIVTVFKNSVTGAASLYKQYTEGAGGFKDIIKSIYNQLSSLVLAVSTQVINKVLGLIGMAIEFTAISICIPVLPSPNRSK